MPFEKEDNIREATLHEVRRFFRNAAEQDWEGRVPAFIDWGRLHGCDGFLVAEHQGRIIGALATASRGMDGSPLPTIANVYVLREFCRNGVGARLLAAAMARLVAAGSPKVFCKAISMAMAPNHRKTSSRVEAMPGVHGGIPRGLAGSLRVAGIGQGPGLAAIEDSLGRAVGWDKQTEAWWAVGRGKW